MASNSIDMIAEKRLRWHKTETILLWPIIPLAAVLIPTGIGLYLYVGNFSISEYVFSVLPGDLAIFQVRMLSIFSRSLGPAFALAGLATITLARNRLSLAKDAYRMAKVIQSRTEEEQA